MKIFAIVFGGLILAGTIVLVIAGATGPHDSNAMGPLAFLLCIVAVAVMIVLGVTLGGRNNPRRAPRPRGPVAGADSDPPGDQG